MEKVLLVIGDGGEVMDTMGPFFRLGEDYQVVVAGPEKRQYHLVQHELEPGWDITVERPAYHQDTEIAFRDIDPDDLGPTLEPIQVLLQPEWPAPIQAKRVEQPIPQEEPSIVGGNLRGLAVRRGLQRMTLCRCHGRAGPERSRAAGAGASSARNLRKIFSPPGVRMDSGWNCTPQTGWLWCRSAMISPSPVHASGTSSAGSDWTLTEREW